MIMKLLFVFGLMAICVYSSSANWEDEYDSEDSTENIPIFVPTYEYERPRQRKFFRPFENPWYTATPHHLRKRQSNFDPWYDQQFLANRNTRARGHAYAPIGKQSGGGQKMFEGGGPKSFRRFSKRSTV